jgi:hypothetical protein
MYHSSEFRVYSGVLGDNSSNANFGTFEDCVGAGAFYYKNFLCWPLALTTNYSRDTDTIGLSIVTLGAHLSNP